MINVFGVVTKESIIVRRVVGGGQITRIQPSLGASTTFAGRKSPQLKDLKIIGCGCQMSMQYKIAARLIDCNFTNSWPSSVAFTLGDDGIIAVDCNSNHVKSKTIQSSDHNNICNEIDF
jgi:hypothetical protein